MHVNVHVNVHVHVCAHELSHLVSSSLCTCMIYQINSLSDGEGGALTQILSLKGVLSCFVGYNGEVVTLYVPLVPYLRSSCGVVVEFACGLVKPCCGEFRGCVYCVYWSLLAYIIVCCCIFVYILAYDDVLAIFE